MATVIDPKTAMQKKVDVTIKDGKGFSEKVFFLEIWSTGNVSSQKTLEVKGEKNLSGAFKQVQFKFDENSNYIYTKSDVNQKEFDKTYQGTASEFSISGLLAGNTNTVVRISKTNSPNDVPEMYNGLTERIEVKVEPSAALEPQVIPGGGREEPKPEELWTSKQWSNEKPRIIKAGDRDPDDSKIQLLKVGDILPTAVIDGKGVCTVSGSSPRIYIDAPNENVEFSAEVLVEGNVKECYLVARSDHEDRPLGFGGYYYYLNFEDQKHYFKKELAHEQKPTGYSERLSEKSITWKKGQWYPIKIAVHSKDGKVVISGSFDHSSIELVDDGSIKCGDVLKSKPFLGKAKWCFIRTNSPDGVKYRNVVLKRI